MSKTIKEIRKEIALDAAIRISQLPISAENLVKKAQVIEKYL